MISVVDLKAATLAANMAEYEEVMATLVDLVVGAAKTTE